MIYFLRGIGRPANGSNPLIEFPDYSAGVSPGVIDSGATNTSLQFSALDSASTAVFFGGVFVAPETRTYRITVTLKARLSFNRTPFLNNPRAAFNTLTNFTILSSPPFTWMSNPVYPANLFAPAYTNGTSVQAYTGTNRQYYVEASEGISFSWSINGVTSALSTYTHPARMRVDLGQITDVLWYAPTVTASQTLALSAGNTVGIRVTNTVPNCRWVFLGTDGYPHFADPLGYTQTGTLTADYDPVLPNYRVINTMQVYNA